MAYSIDLRTRVVSYIDSGGSRLSASKIFKVGERTVRNWINLQRETGSVLCRPHGGGFTSKVDAKKFKQYISDNPDKTLQEIGDHFGITHEGAAYNLRKHGYVYKKTLLYLEHSEEKRQKYLDEIKDVKVEDLVYIDESGIEQSIIKENCWVKKGQEAALQALF